MLLAFDANERLLKCKSMGSAIGLTHLGRRVGDADIERGHTDLDGSAWLPRRTGEEIGLGLPRHRRGIERSARASAKCMQQ